MNKIFKLIISGVLSINLTTVTVVASDLENKKQESNNIRQEISDDKEKKEDLEKSKSDILKEIEGIDNNIKNLDEEVGGLTLKIDEASIAISELETNLEKLKVDLEKSKELMSKRYRALYKNQGQGNIELLFSSEGLSDFIQKLEIVTRIVKHDKEVVSIFKKNQEELDTTLNKFALAKENLESDRTTVQAKVDELNNKKSEKDMLIAKVEGDIAYQEKIVAQKEEEFQKIVDLISQMENKRVPSRGGQVSDGNIYSITGGIYYPITSGYGTRISPITGKSEFQAAVDIGAPYGAGVYSLMDGTVAYSGWMNGYGNVVVINHGGISSLYAHNSSILVSKGEYVKGGQKISLVGSTGWSTGPHIHFEVTNSSGQKIDPTSYYIT